MTAKTGANVAVNVYRAVHSVLDEDKSGAPAFAGPYVAADGWVGEKPGYVFKSGAQGLGYYVDSLGSLASYKDGPSGASVPGSDKGAQQLLQEAELLAKDLEDLEGIDDRGIRRVVAGLERRIRRNQELRMKHSDAPPRFMESELELDEVLRKLTALAGEPELYRQLVAQGSVPLLLELLQHANVDVVRAAAELLQDLTDADSVEDLLEESQLLVAAMLECLAVGVMAARLRTFNESVEEEAAAANALLRTLINMGEIDPDAALAATAADPDLLKWMLKRLHPREFREFDQNKAACAELLAVLAQMRQECRERLVRDAGINDVLVALEPYRRVKAPLVDPDEEEFVFELCNILSACLGDSAARSRFLEDQGVELMLLVIKHRQFFRIGLLKVLVHATTDFDKSVDLCIQKNCLPLLFGIFMLRNKTKGVAPRSDDARTQLEAVTCIVANLLHYTLRRPNRERVAAKFVENEFEKADRLMQLFFEYHGRLHAAAADRAGRQRGEEEEEEGTGTGTSAAEARAVFMLQQLSIIFGHLWLVNDRPLRQRLLLLLHQRQSALVVVRSFLDTLYLEIADSDDKDKAAQARSRVAKLITAMGGSVEELQQKLPAAPAADPALQGGGAGAGNEAHANRPDAPPPPPPNDIAENTRPTGTATRRIRIADTATELAATTASPAAGAPNGRPDSRAVQRMEDGETQPSADEARRMEPHLDERGSGGRDASGEHSRGLHSTRAGKRDYSRVRDGHGGDDGEARAHRSDRERDRDRGERGERRRSSDGSTWHRHRDGDGLRSQEERRHGDRSERPHGHNRDVERDGRSKYARHEGRERAWDRPEDRYGRERDREHDRERERHRGSGQRRQGDYDRR